MPHISAAHSTGNSDALQRFIGSLSATEKAYYVKFSKRHGGGVAVAHLRLFALLASGISTTDAGLQKRLNIRSGSQFSALKTHLLTDLLDALAFMHRRENAERLIHTQLAQLEELLGRNAPVLAQKLHAKTLALAQKHELHDVVIRLAEISKGLAQSLPWQRQKNVLGEAAALHDAALARRSRAMAVKRIYSALESLRKDAMLRFTREQSNEVEILEKELRGIAVERSGGEVLTDAYRTAAFAACRYMLLDFDGARDCGLQVFQTFEAHPWFAAGDWAMFFSAATTVLYADFALKDVVAAKAHLTLAAAFAEQHLSERARKVFSTIHFNTRLKILHKQTDYAGVAVLIQTEADNILRTAEAALPPYDRMNLQCSICISYFVLGEYGKAEDLLLSIKAANHAAQREDVLYFSILFHLLILFERRAWYALHTATDAAYHHLYARKKLRPFEKELMLFLRKLPAVRSGARVAYIEAFLRRLEEYRADPVKRLFFLYFDYYGWLQSKVMGIDYQEYRRREATGVLTNATVA